MVGLGKRRIQQATDNPDVESEFERKDGLATDWLCVWESEKWKEPD
jgi:hypothetical protein